MKERFKMKEREGGRVENGLNEKRRDEEERGVEGMEEVRERGCLSERRRDEAGRGRRR